MTRLLLVAGIPGSGKSTFIQTLLYPKYAVVSSDAIRKKLAGSLKDAHAAQVKPWDVFYGDIRERLMMGVDTVADATFLTHRHRAQARELATDTKAEVHLILFTDNGTAMSRNDKREGDERVPTAVMEGMVGLYYDTRAELIQESYASVTHVGEFHV